MMQENSVMVAPPPPPTPNLRISITTALVVCQIPPSWRFCWWLAAELQKDGWSSHWIDHRWTLSCLEVGLPFIMKYYRINPKVFWDGSRLELRFWMRCGDVQAIIRPGKAHVIPPMSTVLLQCLLKFWKEISVVVLMKTKKKKPKNRLQSMHLILFYLLNKNRHSEFAHLKATFWLIKSFILVKSCGAIRNHIGL